MSSLLASLNPKQAEAVTHTGSPLLILAGAGSGKTKVLTHRAAHLINTHSVSPQNILLLTFTNKAASEMKQRLQKLLPQSSDVGLFAGTFHSFGVSLLRRFGPLVGISSNFIIYDSDDQENLIRSIIAELNLTPKEFKPSSVAYFIESAKDKMLTPRAAAQIASGFWAQYAAKIYDRYQKRLTEYQALDFSDLIYQTVILLSQHSSALHQVQEKYQHLLVDEYQDTNEIQYALTRIIAQKYRQLTVVGDASQSIYGWRGANFRNLMNITADFPDTKIVNLELNYRSTQTILSAANCVIQKNTSHPVLDLRATRSGNNPIQVAILDSEVSEAEFVASQIERFDRQIPLNQIAVLYRTNAQSRVLEEAFLKHRLPYVLIGGLRFYDRAEIKDILAMLRLIYNPRDLLSEGRVQKALGKRGATLYLGNLDTYHPTKLSTTRLLDRVLTTTNYLDKYDPRDEDDVRRLENIKELQSVAKSFPKLEDFLENVTLVQQEYSLQEKNKKKENKSGVRLMTLHSSKGLEFEAVFIVGFEEGILPHSRSLIEDVDIEEERRLSYVGITRAKDYLYLTHTRRRLFFGKSSLNQPSRFLSDIPNDLIETTDFTSLGAAFSSKPPATDDFVYDPDIY